MDTEKAITEAKEAQLDLTASIIESLLDQHNIHYGQVVPLSQYNKVAVHGVKTNVHYDVTHELLDYNIILEGVTRTTAMDGVNLFFREVSIEQREYVEVENIIVPEQ